MIAISTFLLSGCAKTSQITNSGTPTSTPPVVQQDQGVTPSTKYCSEAVPTKQGAIGKYVGFLVDKTQHNFEAIVQKDYDGKQTSIGVTTNVLPTPKYAYVVWLVRDIKGSLCGSVNIGQLEKTDMGIYILRKTGAGSFDDSYQIAISDDPKESKQIQHVILIGSLKVDNSGKQ